MFRDVARYVRSCVQCQKYKVEQRKPPGKMLTRKAQEPFDILCADFVGPLPRSKQGNTVLLVFFNLFSKWVELVPLQKATTPHLDKALRERIFSRFGTPRTFVCDNGTQFTSRSFTAFCKKTGMKLEHTAPYSPQQNPTERANRTVKTMIGQFIEGLQNTWDLLLPEITFAVNSSVLDTTGFSPSFLVMGREPRLPGALYDEVTGDTGREHSTPEARAKQLSKLLQVAKDNATRASAEQSRHHNLRRREWGPKLGMLVLLKQHVLSKAAKGFAAKLAPKYEGSYKVVRFISANIVRLQRERGQERRSAHIADLKPFHTGAESDTSGGNEQDSV